MSKRAKIRALEVYPENMQYSTVYDCVYDLAQIERKKFLKVYELAEKETIERAIAWLKEHINDYIVKGRDIDLMFDDLKKALEEEV